MVRNLKHREYQEWMAIEFEKHLQGGNSPNTFPAKYNIRSDCFDKWKKEVKAIKILNDIYLHEKIYKKKGFS